MQASPTDRVVGIYIHEKCRHKEPFLSFQIKKTFKGNSRVCQMTVKSGALTNGEYGGKIVF